MENSALLTIVIAIVSLCVGLLSGITSRDRNKVNDGVWQGGVDKQLETILNKITEISIQITDMKNDIKENHDDIIILKQQIKACFRKIDEVKENA